MMVKSIICLLFGLIFVLTPGVLLALFGVAYAEPGMLFMAKLYGATFLLLGLLLWLARNAPDSEALRAIVIAVCVGDALGFVVVLVGQLGNIMNGLGWLVVALYLFLSLAFGYGYIQLSGARTQTQPG
jgi:hypothetical protein